jgi:hypothetical protein
LESSQFHWCLAKGVRRTKSWLDEYIFSRIGAPILSKIRDTQLFHFHEVFLWLTSMKLGVRPRYLPRLILLSRTSWIHFTQIYEGSRPPYPLSLYERFTTDQGIQLIRNTYILSFCLFFVFFVIISSNSIYVVL